MIIDIWGIEEMTKTTRWPAERWLAGPFLPAVLAVFLLVFVALHHDSFDAPSLSEAGRTAVGAIYRVLATEGSAPRADRRAWENAGEPVRSVASSEEAAFDSQARPGATEKPWEIVINPADLFPQQAHLGQARRGQATSDFAVLSRASTSFQSIPPLTAGGQARLGSVASDMAAFQNAARFGQFGMMSFGASNSSAASTSSSSSENSSSGESRPISMPTSAATADDDGAAEEADRRAWDSRDWEQDSDAYRLRAGDLIDVNVWGQDNLTTRARVGRDGEIVIRLIGAVRLAGLTVNGASALIARRLRRFLEDPVVTVSIAEPGGRDVVVVGEVSSPGPIAMDRPLRLLDALVSAKWNVDKADLSTIKVVRQDLTIVCDMAAVLNGEAVSRNILLEPGDIVIVPSRSQTINLLGTFQKPGKYVFSLNRALRVKDLLLESSMWTPKADLAHAFVLHPDGTRVSCDLNALWFRGDATQDLVLKNGDSLIIPEVAEIGVYVLGEVPTPGFYTRPESFNLLQALSRANPRPFDARLYDIRVVRGWPGNPRVFKVNVKALLEGDITQNMILETGDVVFVPKGILSYTLEFWNRLLGPIAGTANTIRTVEETASGTYNR